MSFAHHHAEAYIRILSTIPNVELIGVADDDHQRGRGVARENGVPYFVYDDLLSLQPDGVIICSENSKHRLMVEMAADAKVNVLCEKPLATSVSDARAVVTACERAGVLLMTAFPMRFSAPLLEVKARIDEGDFGQVYCFKATNQGELPSVHREWFVDKELAGGGALMDHTVHLVDIMRWYLNSEVHEVYAQTNQIFHADAWQRANFMYWGSDSNQAMLNEFVTAIREDRSPAVTGWDGFRAVEVTMAAYESAESGLPVRLEP
jgi:predicted dehydrogenase